MVLDLTWINLVHLVTFHGFVWAPLYAWLLLVSAWATRAPFIWAVLPPVAIGIVEQIAFDSTRSTTLLRSYLLGASGGDGSRGMTMDMLAQHPLSHFLARPDVWLGLAIAAAMLFGAVKLRRARGVI
jgi:ABC-2 type transport system permease protein